MSNPEAALERGDDHTLARRAVLSATHLVKYDRPIGPKSAQETLAEMLEDCNTPYGPRIRDGRLAIELTVNDYYGRKDELGRHSGLGGDAIREASSIVHTLSPDGSARVWVDFYNPKQRGKDSDSQYPWMSMVAGGINLTQRIDPQDLDMASQQAWSNEQLAAAYIQHLEATTWRP